jgi:hypothetical protein
MSHTHHPTSPLILKLIDIGGFQWSKSEGEKNFVKKIARFFYTWFLFCVAKNI